MMSELPASDKTKRTKNKNVKDILLYAAWCVAGIVIILAGSWAAEKIVKASNANMDKRAEKAAEQIKDIQSSDEYVIRIYYIDSSLKDDIEDYVCLVKKDTYDKYVDGTLDKFIYKDRDGKIYQINVNKIKCIKLME